MFCVNYLRWIYTDTVLSESMDTINYSTWLLNLSNKAIIFGGLWIILWTISLFSGQLILIEVCVRACDEESTQSILPWLKAYSSAHLRLYDFVCFVLCQAKHSTRLFLLFFFFGLICWKLMNIQIDLNIKRAKMLSMAWRIAHTHWHWMADNIYSKFHLCYSNERARHIHCVLCLTSIQFHNYEFNVYHNCHLIFLSKSIFDSI